MTKILFLLALVPFLQSCEPKHSESYSSPTYVRYNTPEEAVQGLEQWEVICANPDTCPDSVGQIVFKVSMTTVGMCTAFLVDSKTIVTNDHCVENFGVNVDVSNQAQIVFPKTTTTDKKTIRVYRLLSKSNKQKFTDADLAILELKEPAVRNPLGFDKGGVSDQELLTVYKVDPGHRGFENKLVAATCRVIMHPFYLPEFSSPLDETVAFTGCETMEGNSGSPMVSDNGKVKAVLFGQYTQADQTKSFFDRIRSGLSDEARSLLDNPDVVNRELNLATNASCLQTSPLRIDANGCAILDVEARKTATSEAIKASASKSTIEAAAQLGEWAANNSRFVVWSADVTSVDDGILMQAKAACIQPSKDWVQPYSKKGWIFTTVAEQTMENVEAPRMHFVQRYDDSLRPYFEVRRETDYLTLQFNPKELAKDRGGDVAIARPENNSLSFGAANTVTLPACGKTVQAAQIRAMYRN